MLEERRKWKMVHLQEGHIACSGLQIKQEKNGGMNSVQNIALCFTRYSGNICVVRWKILQPDNFYDR